MLRHYNQHGGGVRVYTRHLLSEMLALDVDHEFVLLYQDPRLIGSHAGPRVTEVAVRMPTSFLWDQVATRWMERRFKPDVIFNPKYSIPLTARCKTVFVCHGLDWYVMPQGSRWTDRLNHRYLVPRYANKADAIIAVSDTTRDQVIRYLGTSKEQVHTIYHGVDEIFRQPVSEARLSEVRSKYALPERFFLYVGQIYPPKNFGRLIRAYAKVGPELGISLVVAGEHRWLCEDDLALISELGIQQWVKQAGWIDPSELPVFYSSAIALLLPSLFESFGLPLVEAMSVGCPTITANRYGTKEVVDGAGILVEPEDVDSIAGAMSRIIDDPALRERTIKAGRARARAFSWHRCAEQTLRVLESIGPMEAISR